MDKQKRETKKNARLRKSCQRQTNKKKNIISNDINVK